MNKSYLTIIYVLVLLSIGVSIFGGMKIIRNENFIKSENAAPSKQEFMKKNEKKFDIVFKGLFIIVMLTMFIGYVFPGVMDLPNVINNNYQVIDGIATNSAAQSNRAFPKIVTVQSKSGQEIRLRFYSKYSIEKGDKLKIIYLPHLKRGTLLEHS
ncbi:hypothetical protein [Enterococcus wangshanyuanii]|uniref:DUF3592 domain-containing protein n=1 Tax=Enterococcus wangshanyuanii TaxID=2005703 RepID=A0ABQ1PFC4_9ENTE|nr:hypothetical protein [Enterococcus wangshanyuanii]GGC96029.1 hypothetical protein GCM10011573_27080 [Enterococcus wangshanyuanii]